MATKKRVKPGRKPLGLVRYHVLIDPEDLEKIKEIGDREGRPLAVQVRYMLRRQIEAARAA